MSTIPIAIPLMAVKAGVSVMCLPLIGCMNFGILYPLLLVPVGVVGATNAFNMIAGLNGLEAGMGAVIFATLGIIALAHGNVVASVVATATLGGILGFLYWNKYPAKVFPGDVFTYSVGAMIATVAILGNMEGAALILFIPYFLELALYLYGKKNSVEKESWGRPVGDCLEVPYDKPYSVTHLAMLVLKKLRGCAREKEVVLLILSIEVILAVIALLLYL
jgi:UDP-N-acetylglucosamine--dolichyl-phosphate N-acetylglucosaminephosphotransferase